MIGIVRLFWWNTFEADTVILNLLWTVYNLVILGASVAVATETKQVRNNHRVVCNQKAMLKLNTGHSIVCRANDYSEGGLGLLMPEAGMVTLGSEVRVSLFMGYRECVFPARAVFTKDVSVGLEFEALDIQQQMDLVQCTLARADAWLDWSENREVDRPFNGLKEILYHSMRGFQHLGHYLTVRMRGHFEGEPEKVDLGIFEKKKTGLDAMTGRFRALLRAGRSMMLRSGVKITAAHAEVERADSYRVDLKAVMLKK